MRPTVVLERPDFQELLPNNKTISHYVTKITFIAPQGFKFATEGDKQIFVIRNPLDSFASKIPRFPNKPVRVFIRQIQFWEKCVEDWEERKVSQPSAFCLKYEDLFDKEAKIIEKMYAHLGLEWEERLLEKLSTEPVPVNFSHVPGEKPPRIKHEAFRSWQTNQPLKCGNNTLRHLLPKNLEAAIRKNPTFQRYYGELFP
jgi:hypothetical protein